MLVGAGELVEEGGLAAVLVARQGKGQLGPLGEGVLLGLGVILAVLAQAGVGPGLPQGGDGIPVDGCFFADGGHGDLLRVGQAQGQGVAVQAQLHGVAHGGVFHQGDLHPGDDAHV